jgi:hypothetical protein
MAIAVNDRMFLIGLCERFRRELQEVEVRDLLPLATDACARLKIRPVHDLPEGYYADSDALRRYFSLVRALQASPAEMARDAGPLESLRLLQAIYASPAMGRAEDGPWLLPRNGSPLGEALRESAVWSVGTLTQRARVALRESDADLLAVACATEDPVAICVARESVALSAMVELADPEPPRYCWAVSPAVAAWAKRFVSAVSLTLQIDLPPPEPSSAPLYGHDASSADLLGRCILIARRPDADAPLYHWYIGGTPADLQVKDFWSTGLWTTDTLRRLPADRWPPEQSTIGDADPHAPRPTLPETALPAKRPGWWASLLGSKR